MITKNNSIRWGIIGCGNVTEVKSGPPYQLTPGFELYAVMRRNEDKVKDYAHRHNVPKWYTDADMLINNPDIDAVYIATPPDTHLEYAIKVANARKPCCIEKPLAPSYVESKKIQKIFQEKNTPLFVAYYRRSLPRFLQVKTWIDTNELGMIRHIDWQLNKPPNVYDISGDYNWRTDPKISPGGYFDDLACHGLDLFAYYLGDFKEVIGISTNQQGLYKAKDATTASWIHHNGTTGTGSWNFGSHSRKDKVTISGSKGTITFSVFDDHPLILKNEKGKKEMIIEHPKHIQAYHVEAIKKHLDGTSVHPSNGNTAVHTSWVMDKILGTICKYKKE